MSITSLALARFKRMKSDRGNFEHHWQQIGDRVMPDRASFNIERAQGEKRMERVFDSTAISANEMLAAGLHGMLTNPATEWFELRTTDQEINKDEAVRLWLETVKNIIFTEINRPEPAFSSRMHEMYLDLGGFGTAAMFISENLNKGALKFDTRFLDEIFIAEGPDGIVDTVYRKFKMSVRNMVAQWGEDETVIGKTPAKKFKDGKLDDMIEILHVVEPRRDRNRKLKDTKNMPILSLYINMKDKHDIEESGFHEMPYIVPRWSKATGETYGRGPAMTALPDIKMINEMMKTLIKVTQKAADPPWIVEDDSVLNPLRTVPGGLNYKRPGTDDPKPMLSGADFPAQTDMMEGVRQRIIQAFFIDQLQLGDGPQMTATEVLQRTEDKLRLLGPIFGRMQSEMLGPLIERIFGILSRAGKFPEPPEVAIGAQIKFEYVSPLARAQKQLEATGIIRTIETLAPFVEAEPEIMDIFNGDQIAEDVAIELNGMRPTWLNGEAAVKQKRQDRADRQAAADQLEAANSAASTENLQGQTAAAVKAVA